MPAADNPTGDHAEGGGKMSADSIAAVILIGGFFLLLLMRLPVALALALSSVASALYMNVNLKKLR